jgi:hypothetical protein
MVSSVPLQPESPPESAPPPSAPESPPELPDELPDPLLLLEPPLEETPLELLPDELAPDEEAVPDEEPPLEPPPVASGPPSSPDGDPVDDELQPWAAPMATARRKRLPEKRMAGVQVMKRTPRLAREQTRTMAPTH